MGFSDEFFLFFLELFYSAFLIFLDFFKFRPRLFFLFLLFLLDINYFCLFLEILLNGLVKRLALFDKEFIMEVGKSAGKIEELVFFLFIILILLADYFSFGNDETFYWSFNVVVDILDGEFSQSLDFLDLLLVCDFFIWVFSIHHNDVIGKLRVKAWN